VTLGKTAKELNEMLKIVFGDKDLSHSKTCEQFDPFKNAHTEESVTCFHDNIHDGKRTTIHEVAHVI
jgi:hypothetical protein